MENRNGLIVAAVAMRASGHAERLAALALSEPDASQPQPISFGADKGYDAREFVMELLEKAVTPHVAKNTTDRRLYCPPAHSQTRGRSFDYGPPRAVARLRDDFPGRAARCRRVCRCERFDPWPNIAC
jgi:hypothetical protein